MISEILLILNGHDSSLFSPENKIHPDFALLLHPGEQQCLESLGLIAYRYRNIRNACNRISRSPSRYLCALCSKLNEILRNEYEALVVETESKILNKDVDFVGRGSFVPLSVVRATFAEWDSPLAALESLVSCLEEVPSWPAGKLIDLLLSRSETGVDRVSSLISRLAIAVQRVWTAQLQAFLVHGTSSTSEPLATETYIIREESMPSCVSASARDSIIYIGRAIGTVKALKWHRQIPSSLSLAHAKLIDAVLPQDHHRFESVISHIRADISEWLWTNVLTMADVEDAVDSLANYLLMQNGEFALSLIREIERLKQSRLSARSGPSSIIREQDLHLALLRASLGTSAQYDQSLSRIRFQLPSGPVRPIHPTFNVRTVASQPMIDQTRFDDIILGFPLKMIYVISWPLDLFLQASDLTVYAELFSFVSSLRHVHTRIHSCWASMSNAQRARRRWTGLSEGGTADSEARKELLRCGWGVVRLMGWFMDVLLGYIMNDVVETEFRRLKNQLKTSGAVLPRRDSVSAVHSKQNSASLSQSALKDSVGLSSQAQSLDFTTLRNLHSAYLEHLFHASLLTHQSLSATIRSIFEVCEQFVGQVERWGDVLPGLLVEGSLSAGGGDTVGQLVKERQQKVREIDQSIKSLLETFHEQLSITTSQSFNVTDASKTMLLNATVGNFSNSIRYTMSMKGKGAKIERDGETRRHLERLLLRLDFNRMFSRPGYRESVAYAESLDILKEGGLA